MGKNNNIIEINGKRYDAKTGAHLGHASSPAPAHRPKRNIDGVITTKKPHTTHVIATPVKHPVKKVASVAHPTPEPKHHNARSPQPAKTLMRTTVSKPKDSFKRRVKAQSPAALAQRPEATLAPKPSITRLDEQRLKHAKHIPKSQLISRFGDTSSPVSSLGSLPATQAPFPVVPEQTISHTARVAAPRSIKQQRTTADVLQTAIEHASSHTQPAVHLKKRRLGRAKQISGISIAALSLLFVVGLFGVQNINNMKLRVASSKAGFTAGLPNYRPAGYSLHKLNYSEGVVAIHFQSNSDQRTYDITERTSSWDSAGLRDSFVAGRGNYQTVNAAGRTIYLYGDGNATWVSNGIWYQVQGANSLNNEQLVNLAASL